MTKTIGDRRELDALPDCDLIRQFANQADGNAFRILVERHGGLVYHVCWRMLRHHQDAEDAFQATFLVLAQSARRVRWKKSLGNWLYGVAHRLSLKAAARRCRIREEVLAEAETATADPFEMIARQEAEHVLHQELVSLPAKYRASLLLCYLQGKSREEAAAELGCTLGTLKGRLERRRNRLRLRLSLRGVSLPAVVVGGCVPMGTASEAVSAPLVASTVQSALDWSAGTLVAGSVPSKVLALVKGESTMTSSISMYAAASALAAATLALYALLASGDASANPPRLTPPLSTVIPPDILVGPLPLLVMGGVEEGDDAEDGGMIRELPADGSWARYELHTSRSQGGAEQMNRMTVTIASVGSEPVDGKQARWLEVTLTPPEGESSLRTKLLVPEAAFGEKASPMHQIIRAWSQRGDEPARQLINPREGIRRGPLETLFPGELSNAESLDDRKIEVHGLGVLAVKGIKGQAKLVDERGADDLVYRAWSHPDVPFGLVSAEIEEVSPDRAADRTMKLTMLEFGTGATSAMPDAK